MRRSVIILPLLLMQLSLPCIVPGAGAQSADVKALAGSNAAFGFDLYRSVKETDGNLLLSPYSISMALAMTCAGARGRTESEMVEVLHFPSGRRGVHRTCAELRSHMDGIGKRGQVNLHSANALWYQKDYHFLDTYFELVRTRYGAGLHSADFAGQTEAARQAINAWAEEETEGNIRGLIEPGVLAPATALVLCNAIYFRGNWACRFDASQTSEHDFHVTGDTVVKVPMMVQSSEFRWKGFNGFRALELPYEGGDLSMVILLPEAVDRIAELERSLTAANVGNWMRELDATEPSETALLLPKFSTASEFDLASALSAMGMPSAFRDADFSGMTGTRDLFICNVIHKTFVDVNEEGTEAAASTAVVMKRGGAMFRVDRPFLFLIREKGTGSILFMGRIVDPTR